VWSELIGGSDPGWDPLAYAINAAHSRGLEFHAYINTHTCWLNDPTWLLELPDDPNHILYRHCYLGDPNTYDWLHWDDDSSPSQFGSGNYVWFAPGVPGFQAYIRQQVMYVVENYDVDGVHFDRIRTPSGQPSYDPIGLARQSDPQSNPENLDYRAWTADQITRTTQDLYAAIVAVKPHVKVSAAVFYDYTSAPISQHQDAFAWSEAGCIDILAPMMYFEGGAGSSWDVFLTGWVNQNPGNAHIVAGHATGQGTASLIQQIELTRLRFAQGNSVFSWGSFHAWGDYLGQVYQQPAPTPAMPWKDSPTLGVVYGYVTAPDGAAVTDAQVTLSGVAHTALSSADGFYSFLRVSPGSYTITALHPEFARLEIGSVSVAAGDTLQVDLNFAEPAPVGDFDGDGEADIDDLIPFLFCFAGPEMSFIAGHYCVTGDADGDLDVDLADFAEFQCDFAQQR
jgi:uncharacterized lipoprotein YddW (UPF0748 family)